MTQTERRRFLLSRLLAEAPEYRQLAVPDDVAGQKQLLRALLNVRPPRDASPEFLQVQDEYLRAELAQGPALGITSVPTFVINQQWAVAGAQPVPAFVQALRQIAAETGLQPAEPAGSGCNDDGCSL